MKKLSEYTSKDGKFVHQAKAGRYGGSKPDVQKPVRGPSNKDLDKMKKEGSEQYYAIVHKVNNKPLSTHRDLESAKDEWRGLDQNQRQFYKVVTTKKAPMKSEGVAEGSSTTWQVSFDYGPHMSKTVKVKAGSKEEARAKVEKAAEKSYTRGIMINWVKPAKQGVTEAEKKPHPKTWHDVDPKLGKAVDKMSQAEKVKKGFAHPNTLKRKGVAEGVDEKLVGNQHKLDHNKNGKLDADDFKKARAKKKGETATMNPKMDNSKGDNSMEQKEDMIKKESTIRSKLLSIFEKKDPHTKGAISDPMGSNIKGAGAQKMVDDNKDDGRYKDLEKNSHDDASKAGRVTKPAANRPNDNKQGDKKVINPVDDVTKKGQGSSEVKEESMMDKALAYLRK